MAYRYWQSCKRTVEPVGKVATLPEFKEQAEGLGCTTPEQDHRIRSAIGASTLEAEKYTGRAFCPQTWRMTLDRLTCWEILIPVCPVIAVTSIQYVDQDGQTQTLDPSQYQVDTFSEPGRIMPAYGKSWPTTRAGVYNAVTATWTAGYSAIPADIKEPVLMMAYDLFKNPSAQSDTALYRNQRVLEMLDKLRLIWL